ncbi:YeeE/YedE family protein [Palleronia sediminis]|uniref:YeeE/YedE family protein n=1 Tax=Palleronia sediminis TaxID=2547833 RepID=A0A4R6AE12_9RHOB|nr:DUF6691 family protein [Palleronia sediminis]TDL79443.1 YeeE/YedE family protein [Palleronia sediminis]
MRPVFGFLAGLIFGLGLILGGMANPLKVMNFLDIFGTWDPSLAFVMGGAAVTAFVGFRLAWRQDRPRLMPAFDLPSATQIDGRLLGGAAIFGIGWGTSGFCPGPAWVALPIAAPGTLIFVPAMVIGIVLGRALK